MLDCNSSVNIYAILQGFSYISEFRGPLKANLTLGQAQYKFDLAYDVHFLNYAFMSVITN